MSQVIEPDEASVPARIVRVMRGGRLHETLVVAKITFELRPGTCPVADVHEAIVVEAETFGSRSDSVRRIQDAAPPKTRSDVMVVGSAFASSSAHDKPFEARVQIGPLEKALLVRPPRPIGLGPMPQLSKWAMRSVSNKPGGVLELAWEGDDASLNAAPSDQQLDGPIPQGVSITLVNLLPSRPRFSSKLEWVKPVADVPGVGSVELIADTLLIDTDLDVCLVTYRASLGQAHVDAWVDPRIILHRKASSKELVPQMTAEFDAFDLEQHTVDTPFMPAPKQLQRQDTMELEGIDQADLDNPTPAPVAMQPAPSSTGELYGPPALSFGGIEVPPPPVSSPQVFEKPTYIAKGDVVTAQRAPNLPSAREGAASLPKGALEASNDAVDVRAQRSASPSAKLKLVPREMVAPREAPETIELLWFAVEIVPALRTAPALADAFPENLESERGANTSDLVRDVRRALLFAKPRAAPQKEVAISEGDKKNGLYRTQLVLVVGEIAAAFDAKLTLEALLGATDMLLPSEKSLRTLTEAARKLLDTEWVTTPLLDQAAQNLRDAVAKLRDPSSGLIEPTVERLLLEKRAYRTRLVFGGEHLRFTWHDEGRPGIPIYLPGELRERLPMYPKLPVRALVEVRPRQDAFESHAASLLLRAVGRRLEA